MKTEFLLMTAGLLLAAAGVGLGQPVITQQPQSCTHMVGTNATFTVVATNSAPLAYQWQRDTAIGSLVFWDLTGCTNASLVLTNLQPSDGADYRVVITNVDGAVTSDVATLTVHWSPSITLQPVNFPSVSLGVNLTNLVRASGNPAPCYQWCLNGLPLAGRTSTSLVLTNVQLADAGAYTAVATNLAGSVTSRVVTLNIDPTFTKITTGTLVTDPGLSGDATWADYDADGCPDFFIARGGYGPSPLFHNNGDGTFTSITNNLFPLPPAEWFAATWGDFDNDGWPDLCVITGAPATWFYFNNGDGTFTRLQVFSQGGGYVVADYDNDGLLDLYGWEKSASGNGVTALWRNLGGRAFQRMTASQVGSIVGLTTFGYPCWADYDDDGRLELYNCDSSLKRSYLAHKDSQGRFTNVVNAITRDTSVPATCAAWADYDNDGRLDLWVAGYDGPSALYRNLGQGAFAKVSMGVSVQGPCYAVAWGDYDDDGFLDVFLAFVGSSASHNMLLHNKGDGTFEAIHTGSIPNDLVKGSLCATWLDYDNDGFLDLFVFNGNPPELGGSIANQPVNFLYRNNGNTNGWLKIKLVGTVSNRDGIGAKVRVKATYAGQARWQRRDISGGDIYNGNQRIAHFGLCDATNVDVLRIEWPSGIVQEFANVSVKQCLTVTEPAKLSMPSPGELHIQCWKAMAYRIEGSPNLATWAPLATVTNLTGKLQWTDSNAPGQSARFYRAARQ